MVHTRLAILDLTEAGHNPMVWGGAGENRKLEKLKAESGDGEEEKLAVGSHQSSVGRVQGGGEEGAVGENWELENRKLEKPEVESGDGEEGKLSVGSHQSSAGRVQGGGEESSVDSRQASVGKVESHADDRQLTAANSADGGLVIVFNGEIYNFRELRTELEAQGVVFRTRTDTEVILALYARDGTNCVDRLRGMFAFAIWDGTNQSAFLARDPLGVKPLYLSRGKAGELYFASELRALVQAGWCGTQVDPAGLQSFFRFGSVAEPGTILQGVSMLPAGHAMIWQAGHERQWAFWKPNIPSAQPVAKPAEAARKSLFDSVQAHLVSDAPVGVFLSGGLDSTAMAVLSKQAGIKELKTFSIGFAEAAFDESSAARTTAELLGASHREWIISAAEGREMVQGFLKALDQPTVDGLNTYCVSKLAHEGGCKVVLSGLGGDELLGGYPSFRRVPLLLRLHRALGWLPGGRGLAARILRTNGNPTRRRLGEFLDGPGTTMRAWEACRSLFTEAEATALTTHLLGETVHRAASLAEESATPSIPDAVSLQEMTRYMRNQLLRDSDVLSMRWGLELRVPMVDRDLFENLSKIPHSQRLLPGKQLLQDAIPEIPHHIKNQPKRGFTFPFAQWMTGDWQEMMAAATQDSPVPLTNWYQKWALFVFQEWKKNLLAEG